MSATDYTIVKKLDAGKTSKVYLATRKSDNVEYALKVVRNREIATTEGPSIHVHSLAIELRILRTLQHPNIVRLYDVIETRDTTTLVLEYVRGTLWKKQLNLGAQKRVIREVAQALSWLHKNDFVHCDIKPDNILIGPNGIKLCDFGLSVCLNGSEIGPCLTTGTIDFMAPEMVQGRGVRKASDAWSLGATIYEMVHGIPPFDEADSDDDDSDDNIARNYQWRGPREFQQLVGDLLIIEPSLRLTMDQVLKFPGIIPPPPRRVLRSGARRNVDASLESAMT